MALKKYKPLSPDPYVNKIKGDTEFAKLAHLNDLINQVNEALLVLNPQSIVFNYQNPNIVAGPFVTFTKPDYGTQVDEVIPGILVLKRANNRGIYNTILESIFDRDDYTSPLNTEWNSIHNDSVNYGWSNLNNVEDRYYSTWSEAMDYYPPGAVEDGLELVMRETTTNRYWLFKFTQWTEGDEGGGLSYQRAELIFPQGYGITFADGTFINSITSVMPPDDISYTADSSGTITGSTDSIELPDSFNNWKVRVFRNSVLLEQGSDETQYERDLDNNFLYFSTPFVEGEKLLVTAYKLV